MDPQGLRLQIVRLVIEHGSPISAEEIVRDAELLSHYVLTGAVETPAETLRRVAAGLEASDPVGRAAGFYG